ncbi:MAG: EAL domain-containing protein, partial [Candidatus Limnocylindria bacterium]|nr:EAL domain-containing protein [Candidatus Limnocylindria bacterium]
AFIRDVTEEENREAELEHLALFDALTELPNRTLLADRFGLACTTAGRDGTVVGLAVVDLDRFRAVNDALGRSAGDAVLREVARRLRGTVRPGDTIARLDSDEFGIVLGGTRSADEAEAVVQRCLAALRRPLHLSTQAVHLTASAGLTVGAPGEAAFEEYLRRAELSMSEAKRRGGDGVAASADDRDPRNAETMRLVADLHLALERDELSVAYQPIIDLASGACAQVEALARWHHPDRGPIPPAEFIELAERRGLIRPLGFWVLTHALDDLGRWRADGRALGVSVNVSVRQLGDPTFVGSLLQSLRSRGLAGNALTLEITESAFMERSASVILDLQTLRSAGVRISIDDFGTGYSTLASLGQLPVDEVKIDKSFIAGVAGDAGKQAIVKAAAALADALGLAFVAEGVEDEATLHFLRGFPNGYAQGYLMSRPIPPEELVGWLVVWERARAGKQPPARPRVA